MQTDRLPLHQELRFPFMPSRYRPARKPEICLTPLQRGKQRIPKGQSKRRIVSGNDDYIGVHKTRDPPKEKAVICPHFERAASSQFRDELTDERNPYSDFCGFFRMWSRDSMICFAWGSEIRKGESFQDETPGWLFSFFSSLEKSDNICTSRPFIVTV